MISLSEISKEIREYKLKQILDSGENDMFDEKIDKKMVEECLAERPTEREENTQINLAETLLNIEEKKLFEDIINLKEKKNVE